MNKKNLVNFAFGFLVLLTAMAAGAQSAYFTTLTNLNPVGYWPMHETTLPAAGDVETNYGSLGVLGNGFYPDWVAGSPTNAFRRQFSGAVAGSSDTAVYFTEAGSNAGSVTNALYVPHTSPLSTLNPPFSVECWFYGTNLNQGDIWSQNGFEGFNAGASGGGTGTIRGMRLYWGGNGFTVYAYNPALTIILSVTNATFGNWYHLFVTCDSSTNFTLYTNGVQAATAAGVGIYTPDFWTPFEVGSGRGNSRSIKGIVDEVAVYTNVISDIAQHFSDGTNTAPATSYYHDVTNDNPVIYLRMDATPYVVPVFSSWPVLTNYGITNGVAVGNGVYNPGTAPGVVPGPFNSNNVPFSGLSVAGGTNVPQFSGVSSFADAGFSPAYNPTGAVPFSVTAMFRGNPCDNRFQNIAGHSDGSWRLSMNTNGKLQCQLGTNSPSVVNSAGVYNDGYWHQLVEVYTPASNPNVTGTNAVYVDGVLDTAVSTVTTNGILPGSAFDVLIGADPQYTNNPAEVGRQFAGQVCEVALFNTSLTAGQVRTLYDAAAEVVAPYIITQPATTKTNNILTTNTFTVAVNGTDPLIYRWYFTNSTGITLVTNGVQASGAGVSGATNASMTITNLQLANTGYYFVIVTNNYGSVTSILSQLTVLGAPVITSTTTSATTLYAGSSPSFSVLATGATPLSYQWYTNDVPVGYGTTPGYTLTNLQTGSITNYCIVTNFAGSATSAVWNASIIAAPVNPYPAAVLGDKPVAFWRLDESDNGSGNAGALAHDYVGGHNATYFNNVVLAEPGYNPATDSDKAAGFGLLAQSNSYAGEINSGVVPNIDFSKPNGSAVEFSLEAWVKCSNSEPDSAAIIAKGYGGGEQFDLDMQSGGVSCLARNAAGLFYRTTTTAPLTVGQWYHVVAVFDDAGGKLHLYLNGVDTIQRNLAGADGLLFASGDTVLPAANLVSIGARASSQTTNYFDAQFQGIIDDVAVYNYALTAAQVQAHFSSAAVPPAIIAVSPVTYTNVFSLLAGANPAFSVSVSGSTPIYYQWVTNGVNAGGATNASYVETNVQVGTISNYCIVTNYAGSTTSAVFMATVTAAVAPYPMAVMSNNPVAYLRLNEPDNGDGVDNGNDFTVALDYAGGNDGIYTNTVLSAPGYSPATDPTETSAYFGENNISFIGSYAGKVQGIDFAAPNGSNVNCSVEAWVNGISSGQGAGAGLISEGSFNGNDSLVIGLDSTAQRKFRFYVRNAGGTVVNALSSLSPDNNWHHMVGVLDESDGVVKFYIDGSQVASTAITTASGLSESSTPLAIGSELDATTLTYSRQFLGNISDVAIYHYALSAAQVLAHFTAAGSPPIITQQPPATQNVSQGTTLTVSPVVIGTTPLLYHWFDVNAANYIAAQTNSSLVISNIAASDSYYLTASNSFGTTNTSTVAVNVVSGAPQIFVNIMPPSKTVYVGTPVTFSITAYGTAPLYYQWNNGSPIAGATNTTYTVAAPLDTNNYFCTVSNAFGGGSTTNSATAQLVGISLPTSLYPLTVLSNNPIAFWRLGEPDDGLSDGNPNAIAYDYVGGHNASYTNVNLGVTGYNPGDPDTAGNFGIFAAGDSYAGEIDNSGNGLANIDFEKSESGGNAAFSVEAWVKANGTQPDGAGIVTRGYGGGGEQFVLDCNTSKYRFFLRDGASSVITCQSAVAVDANWHHLVGVVDQIHALAHLYVDGVDVTDAAMQLGKGVIEPSGATLPAADMVSIGSRAATKTAAHLADQFKGKIDEVALYNYALTSAKVLADYKAGTNFVATTPGTLVITNDAGQLKLIWSFPGTLLSSTNVMGPYDSNALVGASSPYSINPTNAQLFYRVLQNP